MAEYWHKEAFKQMLYACQECGFLEILWNSRDGVTPYGISCRHCAGDALHKHWHLDHHMPDWTPTPGTRIFKDMTPERLRASLRKRIERYWNQPGAAVKLSACEEFQGDKTKALEVMFGWEWKEGMPDVIEV